MENYLQDLNHLRAVTFARGRAKMVVNPLAVTTEDLGGCLCIVEEKLLRG